MRFGDLNPEVSDQPLSARTLFQAGLVLIGEVLVLLLGPFLLELILSVEGMEVVELVLKEDPEFDFLLVRAHVPVKFIFCLLPTHRLILHLLVKCRQFVIITSGFFVKGENLVLELPGQVKDLRILSANLLS